MAEVVRKGRAKVTTDGNGELDGHVVLEANGWVTILDSEGGRSGVSLPPNEVVEVRWHA